MKNTTKHFKIPKTRIGWRFKSRYYKLMCYIETMYNDELPIQRLHLDNGIILDFEHRTITHEED